MNQETFDRIGEVSQRVSNYISANEPMFFLKKGQKLEDITKSAESYLCLNIHGFSNEDYSEFCNVKVNTVLLRYRVHTKRFGRGSTYYARALKPLIESEKKELMGNPKFVALANGDEKVYRQLMKDTQEYFGLSEAFDWSKSRKEQTIDIRSMIVNVIMQIPHMSIKVKYLADSLKMSRYAVYYSMEHFENMYSYDQSFISRYNNYRDFIMKRYKNPNEQIFILTKSEVEQLKNDSNAIIMPSFGPMEEK